MGDAEQNYIRELEAKSTQKDNKINELSGFANQTIFNQNQDGNLVMWQLELDNILERVEHLLKGDIIKDDGKGNLVYTTPEDKNLIILNDYGVHLIMNVCSFYINRNTILSNYGWDRIKEILYDLGNELADVVYINYEQMGLTIIEKKSRSELLILNILHMIESTYNRAIGGEERESLRKGVVVTEHLGQTPTSPYGMKKARGGFLNPKNWDI